MNQTKPTWVRLATAIGVLCAAFGLCLVILSIVLWSSHIKAVDANSAHLYNKAMEQTMTIAMLATFVCGVILLKYRKIAGRILTALGIVLFIFILLYPRL